MSLNNKTPGEYLAHLSAVVAELAVVFVDCCQWRPYAGTIYVMLPIDNDSQKTGTNGIYNGVSSSRCSPKKNCKMPISQ
jgi:hypothetical protein